MLVLDPFRCTNGDFYVALDSSMGLALSVWVGCDLLKQVLYFFGNEPSLGRKSPILHLTHLEQVILHYQLIHATACQDYHDLSGLSIVNCKLSKQLTVTNTTEYNLACFEKLRRYSKMSTLYLFTNLLTHSHRAG